MQQINVGLIGYKFMGKAHSNAYSKVAMFFDLPVKPVMKAICGRNEEGVKEAAERFGWEGYETSWEKLIQRDDIDLIDITAPSNFHKEIAAAAAEAGKHILCEKPLALNVPDAKAMVEAVEKAGVKHMIGFNYRRAPAVRLAKRLVEQGKIGKIFHFRGTYLQDWLVDPNFPRVWRLDREVAGSGSLGDLGAHTIDLAHYLVGDIAEVVGMSETFVKKRPVPSSMTGLSATSAGGEMASVTVDDATAFLARFKCGALGTFEATRYSTGHHNTNFFEINGSKGAIKFDFEDMNILYYYNREDEEGEKGFRRISVTEPVHDYWEAWWPPGHIIGYEHTFIHEVKDFLEAIAGDQSVEPDFYDGLKCQLVLDAVERSVNERTWVEVESVER